MLLSTSAQTTLKPWSDYVPSICAPPTFLELLLLLLPLRRRRHHHHLLLLLLKILLLLRIMIVSVVVVGWLVGCCCCYYCCCCWFYCYHIFIFNIIYLFLLIHFYYQIHPTAMPSTTSVKNMILLFTTSLVNHICHSLQLWIIGSYLSMTCEEYVTLWVE